MSRVRPHTSESGPASSSAAPSPAVANDTDHALCAGETPKSVLSSGRSGCVA